MGTQLPGNCHGSGLHQYYRNALEEFSNHPLALNSLALALYEMKDYQQALVYYQRAAQAAPEDPLTI
jgi:tetratricopeptide (TPR) repeat protein